MPGEHSHAVHVLDKCVHAAILLSTDPSSCCPSHPHTPCPPLNRCTASMSLASADDAAQCCSTVAHATMPGCAIVIAKRVHARAGHPIASIPQYHSLLLYIESPSSPIRPSSRYHMTNAARARHKTRPNSLPQPTQDQSRTRPIPSSFFSSSPCSYPTRSQDKTDNLNSALRLVSSHLILRPAPATEKQTPGCLVRPYHSCYYIIARLVTSRLALIRMPNSSSTDMT